MNTRQIPASIDLPSSQQLRKSTFIAMAVAAVLLVTVVLPSEYDIDPTRIGRMLGLTAMGQIKTQLATEAEADRQASRPSPAMPQTGGNAVVASASAGVLAAPAPVATPTTPAVQWRDETSFVLKPGEGVEYKLRMKDGAKAQFEWVVRGGLVNFDTHGDSIAKSISYEKGRGAPSQKGELTAAFTGNHGWFWRNRGSADVTITLKTAGDYQDLSRK